MVPVCRWECCDGSSVYVVMVPVCRWECCDGSSV